METKGVTCKIPLDLHNKISEEIRETESTMSKFIEMIIQEHYEKGAGKVMAKGRTLAFQVSEELFQRVKEYLERFEKVHHRRLTQKEFIIGLIEQALEDAEEEFEAAEAAGRSTKLALEQYNAGSTDFTTVVSAQTTQYQQENSVAAAAGNTALQAVALFRALGGGWQPQPLPLPKATIDAMKKRTDWGGMLRDMESVPVAGQPEIPQAETHRGY